MFLEYLQHLEVFPPLANILKSGLGSKEQGFELMLRQDTADRLFQKHNPLHQIRNIQLIDHLALALPELIYFLPLELPRQIGKYILDASSDEVEEVESRRDWFIVLHLEGFTCHFDHVIGC